MHRGIHPAQLASVAAMACSGLALAAVVPALVRLTRRSPLWAGVSLPAAVALPLLVLLHAVVVLGGLVVPVPSSAAFVTQPLLLAAAVVFWLPALADTPHRLSDPGRCLYLFLAAPLLDLPAVGVIAAGHSADGLAMIVGMLPLGLIAAAVTWSWVTTEERTAPDVLAPPAQEAEPYAG
ncbi:hypothetical protein [Streptomyces sp. NK08204]|uniref:hypothetical protein n=1 Tax=Streptomyces sp. NK08204 TaxID=2873260 RepID=UPI001CEC6775|nr:hypothetical protein [Streptomyces sp. NK08204]